MSTTQSPAKPETPVFPVIATTAMVEILLDQIEPSPYNRKTFSQKAIEELAGSIVQTGGVLQPVVLRPVKGTNKFQLVAGERRWLASKWAVEKLKFTRKTISATVKELTDAQAIEITLIENAQREDVHVLELCRTYKALLGQPDSTSGKPYTRELIAERVKIGYTTVCAIFNADKSIPEVQQVAHEGRINSSLVLEISKYEPKLQQRMFSECFGGVPIKEILKDKERECSVSVRDLRAWIGERIHIDLTKAPFDTKDEFLLKGVTSCLKCPKRTGSDPGLFAEAQEAKKGDTCTDSDCYKDKCGALVQLRIAEAQRVPETVAPPVTARDAKHDAQLKRALHSFAGSEKRWEVLRNKGASDADLLEEIIDTLGDNGASSAPEYGSVAYKGGRDPGVWFDAMVARDKPSLRGKELLSEVRIVIGIPLPIIKTSGPSLSQSSALKAANAGVIPPKSAPAAPLIEVQKISSLQTYQVRGEALKDVLYENQYSIAKPGCTKEKKAIYVDGPKIGQFVFICAVKTCTNHGYSSSSTGPRDPITLERKTQIWEQKVQFVYRDELLKLIATKLPGKVGNTELIFIAEHVLQTMPHRSHEKVARALGIEYKGIEAMQIYMRKLNPEHLVRFVMVCSLVEDLGVDGLAFGGTLDKDEPLKLAAKAYKVDDQKLLDAAKAQLESKRPKSEKEKKAAEKAFSPEAPKKSASKPLDAPKKPKAPKTSKPAKKKAKK